MASSFLSSPSTPSTPSRPSITAPQTLSPVSKTTALTILTMLTTATTANGPPPHHPGEPPLEKRRLSSSRYATGDVSAPDLSPGAVAGIAIGIAVLMVVLLIWLWDVDDWILGARTRHTLNTPLAFQLRRKQLITIGKLVRRQRGWTLPLIYTGTGWGRDLGFEKALRVASLSRQRGMEGAFAQRGPAGGPGHGHGHGGGGIAVVNGNDSGKGMETEVEAEAETNTNKDEQITPQLRNKPAEHGRTRGAEEVEDEKGALKAAQKANAEKHYAESHNLEQKQEHDQSQQPEPMDVQPAAHENEWSEEKREGGGSSRRDPRVGFG